MTASGTYAFNPAIVDLVLDAFDRMQIRPSAITPDHMFSAQRSVNQVLVRWSNRGVNLWAVDEQHVSLVSGSQNYTCPAGTVAVLEVFIRSYELGDPTSLTPALVTVNGSTSVTVSLAAHGLVVNDWISIPIPVALAGVVLQGFYQVTAVPTSGTFKVTAAAAATSSTTGGAVPSYATVASSTTVTVTLAAHGFVAGQSWTVHETVSVGGLSLLGDYVILSATTNTLTFAATSAAATTTSASENSGLMEIAVSSGALPQDITLTPMSRTEWAATPTKTSTSEKPTSYWYDRQISPALHLWPVPDPTGPMELRYFRMRQLQDANPQNTETPDIPYRFEEAFCAALAAHLAVKWKPEVVEILDAKAKETWTEASGEDRERVNLNIQPDLSGYFR